MLEEQGQAQRAEAEPGGFSQHAVLEALGDPPPDERDFVHQTLDDYASADLPSLSPADVAALCRTMWAFCQADQGPELRLTFAAALGEHERALSLDLLQIVQPDVSFLVDSVMAELMAQGLTIRAMLHPVISPPAALKQGLARSVIAVLCEPLAWDFIEACDGMAVSPVFYQVAPDNLSLYIDLGLTLSKLGEEARVPLRVFSLDGASRADLRQMHRRAARDGAEFEVVPRSPSSSINRLSSPLTIKLRRM